MTKINSSKIKYIVISVFVIILVVFLLQRFVFSSAQEGKNARLKIVTIPVQSAIAEQKNISRYLSGLGTVNAARTVTIRSRVDGELMALHFTEGQIVAKGDLLAEIDPRPFEIQLQQAKGQFIKNKAALDNAKRDLTRYKQLVTNKVVSQQELESKQLLVEQLEGSVLVDEAAVNQANLQLTYSHITAPISGKIGLKRLDEGNYVSANDANGLTSITQTQPIDVTFTLPETELTNIIRATRLNENLPVEAWDQDNSNIISVGLLLSIDNQIDSLTGTIKLKARFDNQNEELFPNQFVNTRIKIESIDNAIVIPISAIQMSSTNYFVWIIDSNNKVSRHPVTIGPQENNFVVITQGISLGQQVVTDGIDRLKEGATVDIVNTNNKNASVQRKSE